MRLPRFALLIVLLVILAACRGEDETPTPKAGPTAAPPAATQPAPGLIGDMAADPQPRVIGRNPAAAEELAPDGTIEIYFDQPMDGGRTAAAWELLDPAGRAVAGQVTFPQPRILRFKPDRPLATNAVYQAQIGAGASSATGQSLLEGLSLAFNTLSDLAVSQVSPAEGAAEVPIDSTIAVIFNRPVVALTVGGAGDNEPILTIEPPVNGHWEWVNTSVHLFRPAGVLQGQTEYTVRVAAEAVNALSAGGATLAGDFGWTFSTAAPTYSHFELVGEVSNPDDNFTDLRLDQAYRILFSQPMDRASTEAAVSLRPQAGGPAVPLTFAWDDEAAPLTLTITPTRLLEPNTGYELSLGITAESAGGGSLARGFTWRATTVLLPAILSAGYRDRSLQIRFAGPMAFSSLLERVSFDPAYEVEGNSYYDPWSNSLYYYGFDPDTDYTVTIAAGMADPWGNEIAEGQVVTFRTPQADPYARFNAPWALVLLRQGGSTELAVTHRNANDLALALYELTPEQLAGLLFGRSNDCQFSPPAAQLLGEDSRQQSTAANQAGFARFDFTELAGEGELPLGFYYLSLNTPQVSNGQCVRDQGAAVAMVNANLTLKTTLREAMAWLTDLETGRPLPGVPVTLYDEALNVMAEGRTDGDGLVYWAELNLQPDYEEQYLALAQNDMVLGLATTGWGNNVYPWEFGLAYDPYILPEQPVAYVYTDRPLYRPGQPVSFKGIVRLNDDLAYSLPPYETVRVEIRSFDEVVLAEELALSGYGSFEGQLPLDEEATLGQYTIDVLRGEEYIGSGYFDVAEYRKPTFQVTVSAAEDEILLGETAVATLQATYFAGGNLASAPVTYYVQAATSVFQPGGELGRYSFTDFDQDLGYGYFGEFDGRSTEIVAQGQGLTDSQGRFTIEVPTELLLESGEGQSPRPRTLTIEASVVDGAGNQVSGRTAVLAHPAELYAGVRTPNRVGTVDEPVTVEVVLVDWDAQPAAGTVTVALFERRWSSVQEEDARGQLIWRSEVEEIPAGEPQDVTVDSQGRGTVQFTVENGGVYKALVTAEDGGGRASRASTFLWVAGDEFIPWRRTNDNNFDLVADRDQYAPGDTAELLIASPFAGPATALVTVERGHIKQRDVIDLAGNSTVYRLPITGDMAPNIIVSVLIIQGAADAADGNPEFKVGMVELGIDRSEQELNITIEARCTAATGCDAPTTTYGPGETVEYSIQVTDKGGAPVAAELSLALADLAALSLSARVEQPILDFFYSQRFLSVSTALLLNRLIDFYNLELPPEDGLGGGGGKGDFAEYGVERIRQNFPDTAYWQGQLTTDEDGRATVTITLPDNLTTWRMDARASTLDTRVGQATADIVATRPLRLQPQTARFFIVGDQTQLGALVVNNTDSAIEATVSLEAAGATLLDSAAQTVTVAAGGEEYVAWDAAITNLERVDLVFRVAGGGYSDASTPPMASLPGGGLPVYRYEVSETAGTAGQLSEAGAVVESIGLPVFPDWEVSDAEVTVSIAPSLAAAMTDGLTYLEHFPYECTEQTISRFLPNVLTTRALKEAGLSDPALEANLAEQVSVALQRLYSRQRADGGWPWWDRGPSDPIVSAYVLLGLVEAREAGYEVSDGVLTAGRAYLNRNWRRPGLDDGRAKFNRQAFILYALTRAGSPVASSLDTLYEDRGGMDIYGRAFLAQALYLTDDGDPRVEALAADFTSQAILSATGTHWEEEAPDYWNWNTDTRTTAIVLATMAKLEPDSPLVANAARWLMAHRTAGRWQGTQETAWVLMGLTEFMVASGELEAGYEWEVALNGELLAGGTADAGTLRDTETLKVAVADLFSDELNRLAIGRSEGGGNLYYTAHLQAAIPVEQVRPLDQGIIVSRSYFRADDHNTPITSAAQGETFLVRLTVIAPSTLHYLLVEDYLPAGLEAVDTSLATSAGLEVEGMIEESRPESIDWSRYLYEGWGWWVFEHVELRDEKVVLSAATMPPGTYEYVYAVRALIPGTYLVIPPTAWELYFPEVSGRGAGSIFIVE
jgi:alpha-2-macroglobulin